MGDVWEGVYLDSYDTVVLNSDIYLQVRDLHVKAMASCDLVLDSGAGTGNVTVELLEQGKETFAADLSKKALGILQAKCRDLSGKLHIIRLNGRDLPFRDRSFDGISSMFTVHFVDDIQQYLKEHYRVLRRNGLLMLTWRVSGEDMEKVVCSYEESLERRNLLGVLKGEMDVVRRTILGKVSQALRHQCGPDEMRMALEEPGFHGFRAMNNPYFGQCHSLFMRK